MDGWVSVYVHVCDRLFMYMCVCVCVHMLWLNVRAVPKPFNSFRHVDANYVCMNITMQSKFWVHCWNIDGKW